MHSFPSRSGFTASCYGQELVRCSQRILQAVVAFQTSRVREDSSWAVQDIDASPEPSKTKELDVDAVAVLLHISTVLHSQPRQLQP